MTNNVYWLITLGIILSLLLSACASSVETTTVSDVRPQTTPADQSPSNERQLEIVTLLPRDGIPAIDKPEFLDATQADEEYAPDELVIGVEFNGEARAYSIPLLSSHEIVNDTVGGEKIAVTW
jgi:hypothetical protein